MSISAQQRVADLVGAHPLALPVLHALDIDLGITSRAFEACCGAVPVDDAIAAIESAEAKVAAVWRDHAIQDLIDHVVVTYHRPCSLEFESVEAALATARSAHHYDGWLAPLARLSELRADLEHHIEMEDRVVFPWLRSNAPSSAASIRAIQLDNADAMANMLDIDARAADCIAADRDNVHAAEVTERLRHFESWLCDHIHFESNELFPRVLHANVTRR